MQSRSRKQQTARATAKTLLSTMNKVFTEEVSMRERFLNKTMKKLSLMTITNGHRKMLEGSKSVYNVLPQTWQYLSRELHLANVASFQGTIFSRKRSASDSKGCSTLKMDVLLTIQRDLVKCFKYKSWWRPSPEFFLQPADEEPKIIAHPINAETVVLPAKYRSCS